MYLSTPKQAFSSTPGIAINHKKDDNKGLHTHPQLHPYPKISPSIMGDKKAPTKGNNTLLSLDNKLKISVLTFLAKMSSLKGCRGYVRPLVGIWCWLCAPLLTNVEVCTVKYTLFYALKYVYLFVL